MNAYRFDIWASVYHNGKFSHTITRKMVVHAQNKMKAEERLVLKPMAKHDCGGTSIEVSQEFIYNRQLIGQVTVRPHYHYSDGDSIQVSEFNRAYRNASVFIQKRGGK